MLDLMAVNPDNGPMPLYLHAINTILRKMRLDDQKNGGSAPFNYKEFKRLVDDCKMTPAQLMPLQQRLDTLESFMHLEKPKVPNGKSKEKQYQKALDGNDWTLKVRFDMDFGSSHSLLTNIVWDLDNCRSLMSVRHSRSGLRIVQHLSWSIYDAEGEDWTGNRSR